MYEEISGNLFVLDFTTNCTVCNKACSDACIYGCEGRDYPRAAATIDVRFDDFAMSSE